MAEKKVVTAADLQTRLLASLNENLIPKSQAVQQLNNNLANASIPLTTRISEFRLAYNEMVISLNMFIADELALRTQLAKEKSECLESIKELQAARAKLEKDCTIIIDESKSALESVKSSSAVGLGGSRRRRRRQGRRTRR